MPPAKARNGHGHDDKNDSTSHGNGKDKDATNGAQSNHQVNGSGGTKMRRVASAAGTNLRESVAADTAATLAAQSLTKSANSASKPQAQDPSAAGSVVSSIGAFQTRRSREMSFHCMTDRGNHFVRNSFSGLRSTDRFSKNTAGLIACPPLPLSSPTTTNGSLEGQAASDCSRPRCGGPRLSDVKAETIWRAC